MTSIYEHRSVTKTRIMPPAQKGERPTPKLSFAEAAKLESEVARQTWGHPNRCPPSQVEARKAVHLKWLDAIPAGKHPRGFFRAAWPEVSTEGADSRMDILVREGHLIRHAGRPATWERI